MDEAAVCVQAVGVQRHGALLAQHRAGHRKRQRRLDQKVGLGLERAEPLDRVVLAQRGVIAVAGQRRGGDHARGLRDAAAEAGLPGGGGFERDGGAGDAGLEHHVLIARIVGDWRGCEQAYVAGAAIGDNVAGHRQPGLRRQREVARGGRKASQGLDRVAGVPKRHQAGLAVQRADRQRPALGHGAAREQGQRGDAAGIAAEVDCLARPAQHDVARGGHVGRIEGANPQPRGIDLAKLRRGQR